MNILTDTLPAAVLIDGEEHAINTDFRACLRVIMAFESNDLTNFEKQAVMLRNLYTEPPRNIQAAAEMAIKFLDGGKVPEGDGDSGPRVYSFEKDADLIYSAFMQTHGIDLSVTEMHWWKFIALFMDLGSETAFCSLISLRKRVKTGRASKEERQAAREMGDLFELPEIDRRTPDEREAEDRFMSLLKRVPNGG